MGAGESTARGAEQEEGIVDYYKILEVAEDATAEEIKVSKRSCLGMLLLRMRRNRFVA
jgi:DnaJ family protein A protein 5